jgi:hypothetical protein
MSSPSGLHPHLLESSSLATPSLPPSLPPSLNSSTPLSSAPPRARTPCLTCLADPTTVDGEQPFVGGPRRRRRRDALSRNRRRRGQGIRQPRRRKPCRGEPCERAAEEGSGWPAGGQLAQHTEFERDGRQSPHGAEGTDEIPPPPDEGEGSFSLHHHRICFIDTLWV